MGISLKNVYYTYQEGSPFEGQALSDISLEIKECGVALPEILQDTRQSAAV